MRWGTVLTLVVVQLFGFGVAQAQQSEKLPKIGLFQRRAEPTLANPDPLASAFRQGLRELGYIEDKNIRIEHRYAGGKSDRVRDLLNELVQLKVDVLVIPSGQVLQVAKQLTSTIPIVMITPNDPVRLGLVKSLAQPGGNITGITRLTRDLSGKRLEILKELSQASRGSEFSAELARPPLQILTPLLVYQMSRFNFSTCPVQALI